MEFVVLSVLYFAFCRKANYIATYVMMTYATRTHIAHSSAPRALTGNRFNTLLVF